MFRLFAIGLAGVAPLGLATAAHAETDFGVRSFDGSGFNVLNRPTEQADPSLPQRGEVTLVTRGRVDISSASRIASQWGRVTSTYRSPAHNRRVGGVPNSYHLSGRAIDIARRPGVSHWQIAAAFRTAGYNLLESLDEGDHSHFAFGGAGEVRQRAFTPAKPAAQLVMQKVASGETQFRIVYAPGSRAR